MTFGFSFSNSADSWSNVFLSDAAASTFKVPVRADAEPEAGAEPDADAEAAADDAAGALLEVEALELDEQALSTRAPTARAPNARTAFKRLLLTIVLSGFPR